MEKKKLTIEGPLEMGEVAVIVLAETSLSCNGSGGVMLFSGAKKPVYIILISRSKKMVFGINGEQVSIDQLIADFPSIEPVLKRL